MADKIYKMFLNRYTPEYYNMPETERNRLIAESEQAFKDLKIKVVIACNSGWDSEEWDFWGVTEYPNIDAVQKLRQWQDERHWFKYVEAKSVLGTMMQI